MRALNKSVLVLLFTSLAGCGQQLVEFGNSGAGDGGTITPPGNAPTVTSTNPGNGLLGLCIPAQINATFSDAMDPLTIDGAHFTLTSPGPTSVGGAVTYDADKRVASFAPASSLVGSTEYTATITTGAKNQAGTALASDKAWKFTTGTCMSDGSICNLPAGAPKITGNLYANDPAGKASVAKADLVSAYNDAQGRPSDATIVSNLDGQILAPGVYTSGSTMDLAVNGTLTLDAKGDQNAVWIFQLGSALTANNGSKVLLINGAKAANVFWAIGSSSTIGTNVDFKGTVLAVASNSVGTGSTVEGRLVCTTGAITLLSNVITLPAQ